MYYELGGCSVYVLIVDDEPGLLEQAETFLEEIGNGFFVEPASSAKRALELLNENYFDCVVSDYQMPGMDGLELLRIVREERDCDIPFIVFTDRGREEVAKKALNLGADRYLQKRGDPKSQYSVLSQAIEQEVENWRIKQRAKELEGLRSTIREVNQVLTKYRDIKKASEKVCRVLLETKRYLDISLILEKDNVIKPVVSCGEHQRKNWEGHLKAEVDLDDQEIPDCYKQVLKTQDKLIINSKYNSDCCLDCTFCLYEGDHSTVKLPINLEDRKAILSVCLEVGRLDDMELELLKELRKDIQTGFKRMQTEKKLEKIRMEYKALYENIQTAIFLIDVKDNEFKYKRLNPYYEELTGLENHKIRGKTPIEAFGTEVGEKIEEKYRECLEKKESITYEEIHNFPDGEKHLQTKLSPITKENRVCKIVGTSLNITEQKKLREREDFHHSILRHDLRNKLQISMGYHQLLKEKPLDEEVEQLLGKEWKAKQEALQLIERVRKLREAYREDLKKTDLYPILESTTRKQEFEAENRDIEIELQEFNCKVKAGDFLDELFSNIILNSIKHSDGTKLRIQAKESQDKVTVIIEDDGVGIPDQEKEKVFQKDYSKGKGGGTGFGLYFSKEIVKSYEGDIKVKDSELGGARFEITLKKPK